MKTLRLFLSFVIPLFILDQVTKWWCVLHFHVRTYKGKSIETGEPVHWWYDDQGRVQIDVIEGYFWLPRVHNQGVAWGIGNGTAWAPVVFLIVPIVALVVIRILWKIGFFKLKPARYSAPLLVAGILGNVTDRLVQGFYLKHMEGESFWARLGEGYVVDFLAVKIPIIEKDFPVFNVADSCVSIAATLLLFSAIFEKKLAAMQGIPLDEKKDG